MLAIWDLPQIIELFGQRKREGNDLVSSLRTAVSVSINLFFPSSEAFKVPFMASLGEWTVKWHKLRAEGDGSSDKHRLWRRNADGFDQSASVSPGYWEKGRERERHTQRRQKMDFALLNTNIWLVSSPKRRLVKQLNIRLLWFAALCSHISERSQ